MIQKVDKLMNKQRDKTTTIFASLSSALGMTIKTMYLYLLFLHIDVVLDGNIHQDIFPQKWFCSWSIWYRNQSIAFQGNSWLHQEVLHSWVDGRNMAYSWHHLVYKGSAHIHLKIEVLTFNKVSEIQILRLKYKSIAMKNNIVTYDKTKIEWFAK